jgi:4-hydroxythreonine-4-phosphate dehydrogenase
MDLPRIAITPGEPAGVGPDLTLALAQDRHDAELVVVADPGLMQERARRLGLAFEWVRFDPLTPARRHVPGRLPLLAVPLGAPAVCGHPDPHNAAYVLETLRLAAQGCTQGSFSAMVTGPVQKSVINEAGIPFRGHTEFLAEQTGGDPVMLLTAGDLRVALVTTHLPLSEVSLHISRERLERVIRVLERSLRSGFGIDTPRILVCGLNPHAGEAGHLGQEEIQVIAPTLHKLRAQGLELAGPLPADTVFTPQRLEGADAVLAMYHDQGLPVLKYVGFGRAVNVTLGLPIIRTSVDHGTALDLAGTGRAHVGSFKAALALAMELAKRRTDKSETDTPPA